jgi:hypothetical protein
LLDVVDPFVDSFNVVPSFCICIYGAFLAIPDLSVANHLKRVIATVGFPRFKLGVILDCISKRW